MKILVTGATGFIGKNLILELLKSGHDIVAVSRNKIKAQNILPFPIEIFECDLVNDIPDVSKLEGIDCVVHLLGENIGHGRWGEEQKNKILKSRSMSTKNCVDMANKLNVKYFIGASAIGFYKDNEANEFLDEQTESGDHFLAEVCREWENPYQKLNMDHLILRIGVVLGLEGGLIKEVLPLYRRGLGGKLSTGKQWMSWIHINDLIGLIGHHLEKKTLTGVQNAVAPQPCQNIDFNKTLAKYCQRPAFFSVPKIILKLMMGDRSYLALSSQKIKSSIKTSYTYEFKTIDEALEEICNYKRLPPLKERSFHYKFTDALYIAKSQSEAFRFFSDAKNLERITPPLLNFKIQSQSTDEIDEGSEFIYKLKVHGIPMKWKTVITNWKENKVFTDYQQKGPYRTWYHTHRFIPYKDGVLIIDDVKYSLPFGFFGELLSKKLVQKDVSEIFNYRKKIISKVLDND